MDILISTSITLGLMILFFLYNRRYLKRTLDPQGLLTEVREEINQVLTEMNNVTDRNIDIMEDRIQKIRGLIQETDKKIILFQRELKKGDKEPIIYSHLVRRMPLKPVESQGESQVESPRPSQEASLPKEPEEEKKKAVSNKERVVQLYRQGFSPDIIASRVGITMGEVELIISLQGRGL